MSMILFLVNTSDESFFARHYYFHISDNYCERETNILELSSDPLKLEDSSKVYEMGESGKAKDSNLTFNFY